MAAAYQPRRLALAWRKQQQQKGMKISIMKSGGKAAAKNNGSENGESEAWRQWRRNRRQ